MSSSKPAIVIVPGAFHVPAHYSLLEEELAKAGYEVTVCDMPQTGHATPLNDLSEDVALVQKEIKRYLDRDLNVVLAMHSMGGIIGTCACKGLLPEDQANNVSLAYICAFALDEGVSLYSAGGNQHHPFIRVHGEPHTGTWMSGDNPPHDPRDVFYNDCTQKQADDAFSKLKLSGEDLCHRPCRYAAWKDIESNYLVCELDQAIPAAAQEFMSSQEGGRWTRVERLHAGHSPFMSKPEETALFVRKCAGEGL